MNGFDTDLNYDLHRNVQDSQTSTVADMIGGTVATITDIGASLWNSLPGTPEVDTADLLGRISNNALRVYEENPDTIKTASFIGGMFVPMGLAVKGVNAMRNGSKAVNWFTNAGREADLAKVSEMFANAQGSTAEFRALQRGIFAKTAVNQAVDAVAAEVAMVGLMHSHTYMEDYMQDLGKNFAISAMLGGTLGAGIGAISDRFVLKGIAGKVSEDVFNKTLGEEVLRGVVPGMTTATQLQSHEINILNLDNILKARTALGKDATNDLMYQVAEQAKLATRSQQAKLFESFISDDIKALPTEQRDQIMRMVIDKPEMFGVENMKLLTEKELTSNKLIKPPKFDLEDKPSLVATQSAKGPIPPKNKDAVYFPELNLYGVKSDAVHFAGASALGKSSEKLAKELPRNYGRVPDLDSSIELAAKSSAHIEGEYIAAMKLVDSMSLKDIAAIHVSETHGPLLNAIVMRMLKDPQAAALRIKTSDRSPVYGAVLEKRTQELISEGKIAATGPDASYQAAVDKFAGGTRIDQFRPTTGAEARAMLSGWIGGGGVADMRKAAVDYFGSKTGGFGGVGASRKEARIFGEIYESKESVALRAEFQKVADADGNVYLYRGVKTDDIKGHAPLESYTTHVSKAEQFGSRKRHGTGGVKLYKVHVDDIVAGFSDIGGGANTAEIVVRAGARPVEATLDAQGNAIFKAAQGNGQIIKTTIETITTKAVDQAVTKSGLQELSKMLVAQKQDAIDTLLANGIPFASIAKKTNTDINVVKSYATFLKPAGEGLESLIPPNVSVSSALNTIKTMDDVEKVLAPTNQPLVLSGNLRKNKLYTENHIALNNRTMTSLNKEFIAATLAAGRTGATNELFNVLFHPEGLGTGLDVVAARIGAMNNELGGSGFFNSFDFLTRNMGEVGPVVSAFGKKVQQISNNMIKSVTTPIVDAMSAVRKDAGAMVEYSTFFNINSTLKGWRGFTAEGKLVQKVERDVLDPVTNETKKQIVLEPVHYQGKEYVVTSESVKKLIMEQQAQSAELKRLSDTLNRIKGTAPISDIGLWIPSFNPVNKFIAYVHDRANDTTKLLHARTAAEYDNVVNTYKKHLKETGQSENIEVVTKNEQKNWNILNGRLDPIHMERADISMQKTGSSSAAIIKPDIALFGEIAGGYEHYITAQVRNLTDLSISEITDPLRKISDFNQRHISGQPLTEVKRASVAPKDVAAMMRNALLGGSNLGEYAGWQSTNKTFETGIQMASNAVADLWDATVRPLTRTFFGGKKEIDIASVKKIDFKKFSDELDARGISYPWKAFDEEAQKWARMNEDTAKGMGFFNLERNPDTTKRIVYASNALAATMALRFGELAQPLVNMLSMPILTGLAIAQKMPETFMGVQKGTANVSGVQVMYEGVRAMHSPHFAALNKRWQREGYFSPMVSEASDIIRATRSFDKGAIAAVENALDSNIVSVMSKPADYAESMTRKAAMNTGAVLAKRLYPELDDTGVTIFARDFMDKAIGNFHASQRPVMFQGTLGVALGLFQTYTLTLGQSVYRHLELKNYKALGKASLTQATIFGGSSLPGFDQVSQAIGDHFSDDNVDLTTGTYRAVGDKMADFVLYGLPSNLPGISPALSSRGDVQPRLPVINPPVAYNFVAQTVGVMGQLKAGLDADFPDKGRALAQAMSLQNMSRPVARLSELASGYSITGRGNTVQTPEEVWTFTGIAARLMSTRPLEEQKLRDADHLNHFYGALDRDNREAFTKELRTSIRNGSLTEEKIAKLSDSYLRHGGTPAGWRSAYSTAVGKTETAGKEVFVEKLKPNNPLNYMIDNLD